VPDCAACRAFDGERCTAFQPEWPMSPVNRARACVVAIGEEYHALIAPGSRVLEIGCGTWSPTREHCARVGAAWDGIDINPTYFGAPTIATRIESVEDLSFPDATFDLVIGNQTLEHWNEFGCRPEVGLWQCFRVCRPGGLVCMNVPIHFHGSRLFVEGDLPAIEALFRPFADRLAISMWGRDRSPLAPVDLIEGYAHPGPRATYVLDVRATRAAALPPRPAGYRVRWRPVREVLDHRPAFLLWKVRERLRARRG
jgi:SAM-dependent methyltransferase